MTNEPNDIELNGVDINPATGLPMIDDAYIDVGGSLYGCDAHQQTWTPDYWQPSSEVDIW